LGRIFLDHGDTIEEQKKIGGIFVYPQRTKNSFFISKEALEIFFHLINIRGQSYVPFSDLAFLEKGQAAKIMMKNQMLGWIGSLQASYTKEFDLEKSAVTIFELDQTLLNKTRGKDYLYTPLPKFPPVIRDLAIVIDKKTPSDLVERTIRSAHPAVAQVDLFDVYEGEHIGNDKRSLAYNITYLDQNKTLVPQDIEEITKKILSSLQTIGGSVRSEK
jgi:phenylalanyl-tRNA synthetase beta chain